MSLFCSLFILGSYRCKEFGEAEFNYKRVPKEASVRKPFGPDCRGTWMNRAFKHSAQEEQCRCADSESSSPFNAIFICMLVECSCSVHFGQYFHCKER